MRAFILLATSFWLLVLFVRQPSAQGVDPEPAPVASFAAQAVDTTGLHRMLAGTHFPEIEHSGYLGIAMLNNYHKRIPLSYARLKFADDQVYPYAIDHRPWMNTSVDLSWPLGWDCETDAIDAVDEQEAVALAEEVVRDEAPYQERVLAHLQASLTLPVTRKEAAAQQEDWTDGIALVKRSSCPYARPPEAGLALMRAADPWPTDAWGELNPVYKLPGMGGSTVFTAERLAAERQRSMDEIVKIIEASLAQQQALATEVPSP